MPVSSSAVRSRRPGHHRRRQGSRWGHEPVTLTLLLSLTAPLTLLSGALLSSGCDDPPLCYEGEFAACFCGQEPGYQGCSGGEYAACVCDGNTPGLVGGLAAGGGGQGGVGNGGEGGAALLPFLATCDDDKQCETMLCHVFNAKGPRCSKPCDDETDCPPPSPGCNMMGICKAP